MKLKNSCGNILNIFSFVLFVFAGIYFLAILNRNRAEVTVKKSHIIVFPSFDENTNHSNDTKDWLNTTLLEDFYKNQAKYTILSHTRIKYDEFYKKRVKRQEYVRKMFEEMRASFPNYLPSCPPVPENLIGVFEVKQPPSEMNAICNTQNTIEDLKYVEIGKLCGSIFHMVCEFRLFDKKNSLEHAF